MPDSSRRLTVVAAEHPVDREVLADVAQEVDGRQAGGPVVVVDHGGGVRALEAHERLDLAAYALAPVLDRVEGVERALPGVLGVADHAGGAADQEVRRVAGVLQPARGGQLEQVAHVETGGGRVEADIEPHAPGRQGLAQRGEVRRVGDQAAPLEVVQQGRVDAHARPLVLGSVGGQPAASGGTALHRVAAAGRRLTAGRRTRSRPPALRDVRRPRIAIRVQQELRELPRVQAVEHGPHRDPEVEGVDPHERLIAGRELPPQIHVAAPELDDRAACVLAVASEHVPTGVPRGRSLVRQAALGVGQPPGQGVDVGPSGHEVNLTRERWGWQGANAYAGERWRAGRTDVDRRQVRARPGDRPWRHGCRLAGP